MQVLRECAKRPAWNIRIAWVHSSQLCGRSDINRRSAGVDPLQVQVAAGCRRVQDVSAIQAGGRGPSKFVIFLAGFTAAAASPLSSAHQPMSQVF
jgi:hypothetical protein